MLVSGTLKVCRSIMPDSKRAVQLLFPGDFVGGLFAPDGREALSAVTAAELCVWSRETVLTIVRTHAPARHLLLRRAFANLEDARRWTLVLGRQDAAGRLAAFLLAMARRLAPPGFPHSFVLPLDHLAIGGVLGLPAGAVTRQLAAFSAARLIHSPEGGRVEILNHAALTRLAQE